MAPGEQKLCFVIMPFGQKDDVSGELINFDDVYEYIIKEVVRDRFGFKCIRSDEIMQSGWIHADMLEYIFLADVAIVDITSLNPNVFYELGVRHALRPGVTILIRKKGTQVPFNIRGLRVIDYDLDLKSSSAAKKEIEQFIRNGLEKMTNDSIVYQVFPHLKVAVE